MGIKIDDSEFTKPFISPLCLICARCHNLEEPTTCDAFPLGIPSEILRGEFVHISEFGDEGTLLFKPVGESNE